MNMLRNFTIRFVMLAILGIFCLMWRVLGCTAPGLCLAFQMATRWTASWSSR